MNKPLVCANAAIVLLSSVSCAPTVEQSRDRLTPISYHEYKGSIPKSVGLLRRLIIPPAYYIYVHDGDRDPQKEEKYAALFRSAVQNYLVEKKGYDIEVLSKFDQSKREALGKWANESELGSIPPNNIKQIVDAIGRTCPCDGILILNAYQKPTSTWVIVSVIVTASLTWPLIFMENRWDLDAIIIETSSGKIVWRSHVSEHMFANDEVNKELEPFFQGLFSSLVDSIEAAVPEVLTE
jgi:hypothetical protein